MSGVPEPRWRRLPEERPTQILQAALEVFDEQGLADARLEDIAKRAGVSKGTIYLYFPNKEELFQEVIRMTVIANIDDEERLPPEATATDQLRRYMRRYWDFSRTKEWSTVYRLVIGELHRFPDLTAFYMTEVVMRKREQIVRVIQRGIESGEFRPVDPMVAARTMASMFSMHSLFCRHREFFPDLQDRTDNEVFDQISDFYLHALRACSQ
jgi:AcrR family transcriptional regulator